MAAVFGRGARLCGPPATDRSPDFVGLLGEWGRLAILFGRSGCALVEQAATSRRSTNGIEAPSERKKRPLRLDGLVGRDHKAGRPGIHRGEQQDSASNEMAMQLPQIGHTVTRQEPVRTPGRVLVPRTGSEEFHRTCSTGARFPAPCQAAAAANAMPMMIDDRLWPGRDDAQHKGPETRDDFKWAGRYGSSVYGTGRRTRKEKVENPNDAAIPITTPS